MSSCNLTVKGRGQCSEHIVYSKSLPLAVKNVAYAPTTFGHRQKLLLQHAHKRTDRFNEMTLNFQWATLSLCKFQNRQHKFSFPGICPCWLHYAGCCILIQFQLVLFLIVVKAYSPPFHPLEIEAGGESRFCIMHFC